MTFVICSYGDFYVPFLRVCLRSLEITHPDDRIVVVYQAIAPKTLSAVKDRFQSVEWLESDRDFGAVGGRKAASADKTASWKLALDREPVGRIVCFLDVDTAVSRNVSGILGDETDVLYTWREGRWPINLGVLMVKRSAAVDAMFVQWLRDIDFICANNGRWKKAIDDHGGPDQAAIYGILSPPLEHGAFSRSDLSIRGAPCSVLNQVDSVPLSESIYIYHFKGGWKDVLIRETGYTKKRPEVKCAEMAAYWRRLSAEAQ